MGSESCLIFPQTLTKYSHSQGEVFGRSCTHTPVVLLTERQTLLFDHSTSIPRSKTRNDLY